MPSREEQLAAFSAYKFEEDQQWKEYFNNLTIPPGRDEAAVLRRYKQKYYKRFIDSDFELDAPSTAAPPPSSAPRSQAAPARAQPAPRRAPPRAAAGAPSVWQLLEADNVLLLFNALILVLGVMAIFPLSPARVAKRSFLFVYLTTGLAAAYAIKHRFGGPRSFSLDGLKTWVQPIVISPEFLSILTCILFLPSSRPIALAVLPQVCGALLAVAQYLRTNFSQAQLYKAYFERLCLWLEQNRQMLQGLVASTEISLGFLLLTFLLTAQRNIFQTFLYWQLLKVKYQAPASSWQHRQAWAALSQRFEPLLARYAPFLVGPIGYVKRWFTSLR